VVHVGSVAEMPEKRVMKAAPRAPSLSARS